MTEDGLTTLPTHHAVPSYLGDSQRAFGVVFDVDGLIMVTDCFGHMQSDEVLVEVATALQQEGFATGGQTFRIGGDEFLVVLPKADRVAANAFARLGIDAVAKLGLEYRHHWYPERTRVEVNAVVCEVTATLPGDIARVREWVADEIYRAKGGELRSVPVIADSRGAIPSRAVGLAPKD